MSSGIDAKGWTEIIGAIGLVILHVITLFFQQRNHNQISDVQKSVESFNIPGMAAEILIIHESLERMAVLSIGHERRQAVVNNLDDAKASLRRRWPERYIKSALDAPSK